MAKALAIASMVRKVSHLTNTEVMATKTATEIETKVTVVIAQALVMIPAAMAI